MSPSPTHPVAFRHTACAVFRNTVLYSGTHCVVFRDTLCAEQLNDALAGWPSTDNNPQQPPTNPTWPGGQAGGGMAWPGQPTNPTWPGQPTNPTWPGQPTNPTWPGQPTNPTWPGQPTNPTWPGQPTNPTWPDQPPNPSSQPNWPGSGGGGTRPGQPGPGPGPGPGYGPSTLPQKDMRVPYNQKLPNGVYDKLLITIVGTINPNADKVSVDMSTSKDLAFHFNPRFNENGKKVIIRNSCIDQKWGKEERDLSGSFPFTPGQRFEMKILCTNTEFRVAVNNVHLLTYQHRMRDLKNITQLSINNNLTLSDVRFETEP